MATQFILYDARARFDGPDDAAVLVCATSEAEARKDSRMFEGTDAIWYEYDKTGNVLSNEKARPDLGQLILRSKRSVT